MSPHSSDFARTDASEIGENATRFLAWARHMGWMYKNLPAMLERFEGFAKSQSIERIDKVDTALVVDYMRYLRTFMSVSTVNHNLCALRALWRWLIREGLASYDVTAGATYLPQDHYVPYIYTRQELRRIFQKLRENIRQADTARKRHAMCAREAAFGLMRDCGLRVSEACGLNIEHYDPNHRTLRIDLTKFFKTRVIPVPRSTCLSLDTYLELRRELTCHENAEHVLFLSATGLRISRSTLEYEWKLLLEHMGIYRARQVQGRAVFGSTDLHSMRHAFAVHRLEEWYRQGIDVESMLPLLSAYMGHSNVSYTTLYLHLTPSLGQMANERFGRLALPALDKSGHVQSGKERE